MDGMKALESMLRECELEVLVCIWGCQTDVEAMGEEEQSPGLLGWGPFEAEGGWGDLGVEGWEEPMGCEARGLTGGAPAFEQ